MKVLLLASLETRARREKEREREREREREKERARQKRREKETKRKKECTTNGDTCATLLSREKKTKRIFSSSSEFESV